ncbi:uncharacterized protein LOC115445713 [Manduca sexta]|uniref:Uncharacterized protein n=1 Tax=Manduca sexta TaxID=7130 RepID=A0A921Z9T0_MANSE|nr:uncharacterized protein LOC115445713 [Manduca sexta]KAG6453535.1 hypothetical protein O3G_MSEX008224 [Manduca sexta]
MGRFIFLFFSSLLYGQISEGAIWEHGEDLEGSKIISEITGQMTIKQKTRQLTFNVPKCMQIIYVRADISNDVSTPAIHFNKHSNIVTIHYKPVDKSVCQYKVTAKAITDKKCASGQGSDETGSKPDNKFKKRPTKKQRKYTNKSTKRRPAKRKPVYF